MPPALVAARPDLLRLTKTDSCPQVRHRAHLLLAVLAHGSLAGAARATGTAAKTIGRWRDRFLAAGRAGLVDQSRAGRPRRITPAADQLLDAALAASPMDYGYPVATWGLVDLADLLRQRLGIASGPEALSRHLKRHGYVYAQPRHDLTHRQDAEAVESAKHTLRTLEKKGAHRARYHLLYLDECTLHSHPDLATSWQRRGCPRRIAAAGTDKRVTVFGALDYGAGRVHTMMADRGCGSRFRQFLERLVRRWPTDQLVLVMDNVAYHRTAAVRAWLAAHAAHVTVCWLPTDSPHLNRIERVWRFVKGKLAGHRFWNDRPGLIHAANHLLHRVEAQYADPDRPHLSLGQNFCRSA